MVTLIRLVRKILLLTFITWPVAIMNKNNWKTCGTFKKQIGDIGQIYWEMKLTKMGTCKTDDYC